MIAFLVRIAPWFWGTWIIVFLLADSLVSLAGHEELTLTHFLAIRVPMAIRVALLAWLVYHFCFEHIHS